MTPGANRFHRLVLVAGMLLWLSVGSTAWACPNCRDALASDASHGGLVQGLFWSILFLLSMPFLIFAGLSGYFYYLVRRARLAAAAPAVASASSENPFAGQRTVVEDSLEVVEV